MATVVTLRYSLEVEAGGHKRTLAQPTATPTVSLDSEPADYAVPIEAGETAVIWSPTVAASAALPASFKLLMLTTTDDDVMLEVTANKGGATARTFAFELGAGVPFLLRGDASLVDVAVGADVFDGTVDVIDEIRAKNLADDGTAVVRALIGT